MAFAKEESDQLETEKKQLIDNLNASKECLELLKTEQKSLERELTIVQVI